MHVWNDTRKTLSNVPVLPDWNSIFLWPYTSTCNVGSALCPHPRVLSASSEACSNPRYTGETPTPKPPLVPTKKPSWAALSSAWTYQNSTFPLAHTFTCTRGLEHPLPAHSSLASPEALSYLGQPVPEAYYCQGLPEQPIPETTK